MICHLTIFQILTAAHCLILRKNKIVSQYEYMEIRAGIIRQNSFTPHEQTVRVLRVVIHNGFDLKSNFWSNISCQNICNYSFPITAYGSDIALLELAGPLRYNRWVQPICLPTNERVTMDSVPDWIKNYETMTCLAVRPFRMCISHFDCVLFW